MPKTRDAAFAHALGLRIRAARQAAELTAGELGEPLELTQQMISKYETGNTVPTADVLAAIARVLGTTVANLVGETNARNDRGSRPVRYRG